VAGAVLAGFLDGVVVVPGALDDAGVAALPPLVQVLRVCDAGHDAGEDALALRLVTVLALTAIAAVALAAAGTGAHLAGGNLDVLRNLAGMTGIGLLCAAALGGLAWVGPTGYMVMGAYGLYTQWHQPALTTPWIWPARPPHDLGAALCAALVFTIGMAVITVRGARDPAGESN